MPGGFGSATSPVDGGYNPLTLTTQLATGDRVGSYQIVSPLGAGGMGEVFRARDTRLNREVAIKILPPAFADDPDRLARFTREAQTLAALNHPNIAQIHGFEESSASAGGVRALVMELVPGEDLSTMTGRGPLSIPDALSIARQIADALEAAHEQGIIHRDLKPGNVKVRPDGTIKVLDFGLAKALAPEAAGGAVDAMHSPTLTQRAIYVVSTNGTLAYVAGGPARYAQRVVWVDRAGPVEALPLPERDYEAVQHGSRPTGSGLPTSQRSLGPSRSTSCRFRVQAPEFRSPPAAATVRCGRRMVASCIT